MEASISYNIKALPRAEQLRIKKMTLEVIWSRLCSEVEFRRSHLLEKTIEIKLIILTLIQLRYYTVITWLLQWNMSPKELSLKLLYNTCNDACELFLFFFNEGHFRLMNSSIQTQWLQQREPRLIHRSVYMIKNAVGINYHYSARSRDPLDGLIHMMNHDITYIDVYESTFMFPKAFFLLWWDRKWV